MQKSKTAISIACYVVQASEGSERFQRVMDYATVESIITCHSD